jgi:hypothetical protein
MTLYARLSESGLVLETCCCNDPAACFHPDIAKEFKKVPEGAEPGDSIENGKVVKPTPPEPLPAPAPVETRNVSRMEFLNTLTRTERIALTDLSADDAELQDFLTQLEINGHFDLLDQDDIALLDRLEAQGVLSEATVTAVKALK